MLLIKCIELIKSVRDKIPFITYKKKTQYQNKKKKKKREENGVPILLRNPQTKRFIR